jgi:hypothetical protein
MQHVIPPAPRIWRWLLNFWKICEPFWQGNKACHGDGLMCIVKTAPCSFGNLSDTIVKLAVCCISAGVFVRGDVLDDACLSVAMQVAVCRVCLFLAPICHASDV